MKKFDIYTDTEKSPIVVKQGFSWLAFFFTFIWALFNKMWLLALILFCAIALFGVVEDALSLSVDIIEEMYENNNADTTQIRKFGLRILVHEHHKMVQVYFAQTIVGLANIAAFILFGFHANNLKRKHLLKKGYTLSETIQADSAKEALWKRESKRE